MSSQSFFKLECNGQHYYLLATENEHDLDLILTDASKAWIGKVCHGELLAKNHDVGIADYEAQTRNALTGVNTSNFEYELKHSGGGSLQLIWKKVIEKDSIKFQLGSTALKQCENASTIIASTFDHLIDLSNSLRQQMAAIKLERDRLADERATALEKLECCASIKEDTEQNLFSKFATVLNEKKAKIRQLKAKLDAVQSSSIATQSARLNSSPYQAHRVSESAGDKRNSDGDIAKHADRAVQSDGEYNTDDEMDTRQHCIANCTTVTSSSKSAEDAKRNRTTSGGNLSPLNCLGEESESNDDEDLPIAKRGKKVVRVADKTKSEEQSRSRIPCMLSTTGTTNTSTISSDHQSVPLRVNPFELNRRLGEFNASQKLELVSTNLRSGSWSQLGLMLSRDEAKMEHSANDGEDVMSEKGTSSSKKESQKPGASGRSTDIDDLIGDMA